MREYRIIITNHHYTEWYFVEPATYVVIETTEELQKICPIKHKLLSTDVFTIDQDGTPNVVVSPYKTARQIAGVLILETQKTYGRNETGKRPLFMCIPNDHYLPHFLIPYELKLGFSKKIQNRYVVFKYDNWKDKHPHGILTENLGVVGQIDVFYEYQIYCRNLNENINEINAKTREALAIETKDIHIEKITREPKYNIIDKTRETNIFTIDPQNSVDYDDAFSITWDARQAKYTVCIYIANVFVWLDKMKLWKSFSRRVSTIYLPDRKRPMLPTILSDNLCSLHAGQIRFATELSLSICLNPATGKYEIVGSQFQNVAIRVAHNYVYDTPELWKDQNYKLLLECTSKLVKNIADSHDVVAYWMIQMNSISGKYLAEKRVGIFRETKRNDNQQNEILPSHLSPISREFVANWRNTCGQYCLMEDNVAREHEMMRKTSYCHITSPIRRLVDLLNQMIFTREIQGGVLSEDAADFLSQWIKELDYINTTMRSIRKVQNDCSVLEYCHRRQHNMDEIYEGIVFDRVDKNDGTFVYMVYLEGIRFVSKIISSQVIDNYSVCRFQMFVFEDEYSLKKKVKLQMI